MKRIFLAFILFTSNFIFAQVASQYAINNLSDNLKKDAHIITRYEDVVITIKNADKAIITTNAAYTIMNKQGYDAFNVVFHYDKTNQLKAAEIIVYDKDGNQIDRIKKNDLKDASAVSSVSLYEDNRVKYLEYYPKQYPLTFKIESEELRKTTAFLPSWYPIDGYFKSVQSSSYKIVNETAIKVKFKETRLQEQRALKKSSNGGFNV